MKTVLSRVRYRFFAQPDGYTRQSACIAMIVQKSIHGIWEDLSAIGDPGDPSVMAQYLREKFGKRYTFADQASLNDMASWLTVGEFLITHTWLTPSGHVIAITGCDSEARGVQNFKVADPWSEYDFSEGT